MKLKLARKFQLKETVTLTDPMLGWRWTLRYYGNPEHAKYLEDNSKTGDMMRGFVDLQSRCSMAAGVEAASKNLKGEAQRQFLVKRASELYQEKVFEIDMAEIDMATASPDGLIAHVIVEIEGPEDEESGAVEYGPDLGAHVLGLSEPIPGDYEEGEEGKTLYIPEGTSLGTFFRRWVVYQSQQLDNFRESSLVEAGKASAAS